jgi:hypothetical protein
MNKSEQGCDDGRAIARKDTQAPRLKVVRDE